MIPEALRELVAHKVQQAWRSYEAPEVWLQTADEIIELVREADAGG